MHQTKRPQIHELPPWGGQKKIGIISMYVLNLSEEIVKAEITKCVLNMVKSVWL